MSGGPYSGLPATGASNNKASTGNPVPINNMDTCPACGGSGIINTPDGTLYQMCPLCNGTGIFLGVGSFYAYDLEFQLTALQQALGTVLIQQNKDFRWLFAIAQRTGTFRFTLDINGNQFQTVFNQQGVQTGLGIEDTNFWGTSGNNPFPLPIPILIPAYNRLNVTVTDTSNADNNISMLLIGAHFDIAGGSATATQGG